MGERVGRHVGLLLALMGALALSGMLVVAGLRAGSAHAQAGPAPPAACVDAVLAQPRRYLHTDVTVTGEVLRLWGRRAVALRSHSVHQGLLVVLEGQSADEAGLRVGQRVEVWGEVRPMGQTEMRALDRWLLADANSDRLLTFFGRDPYILAREIRVSGP